MPDQLDDRELRLLKQLAEKLSQDDIDHLKRMLRADDHATWLWKKVWKILGYYGKIRKEVDDMPSKNILFSKTFWSNIAAILLTASDVLPTKYAVPVLAVGNILLRLTTNQPANLFGSPK